jgi:hypothetical protein
MSTTKPMKALIDTEQLKTDALRTLEFTGGLMIGHVGNTFLPIENKLLKSGVVTIVGVGSCFIPIKDENIRNHVKPVMYGVAAYGVISLLRAALIGDSVTTEGQAGIAGIGNSPMTQKIVNMFLPNLGDVSAVSRRNFSDEVFDIPEAGYQVEDQDAHVIDGTEDFSDLAGGREDFSALAGGLYEDGFYA